MENISWEKEFFGLQFSDKRLQKRFFKMMDSFSREPGKSILSACGSRSQAKAVYRLLANDELSCEELLNSISQATIQKMKQLANEKILLIQDTTELSFGYRDGIKDLGYYCDSKQKGMLAHSCIAVTQKGLVLGLVHQEYITRKQRKNTTETYEQRKRKSIEKKESFKWISTLRKCHEIIPNKLETIMICDREGDFYELFAEAKKQKEHILIRLFQNRAIGEEKHLFEKMKASPVRGNLAIQMSRNAKEHLPSRIVKMEYHYEKVKIQKPYRRTEAYLEEELEFTVIYVHEAKEKNGIHWYLITNVEIKTEVDAEEQIKNYIQRWKIERFHYILKSGCKIEEKQVRSYEKLSCLTLLYSVIALQIMHMTDLGRLCPELSAELFLEKEEIKLLYCAARKTKILVEKSYTIKDMILDLAALGGRKLAPSDGMPGVSSIWKGLEKFYILLAYKDFI
ncbi:MAG: IS4 family transposase [Fibrobacteraceae bacterium]|nr:IS4 family transposase [Fibrobacteraceae bacterium]